MSETLLTEFSFIQELKRHHHRTQVVPLALIFISFMISLNRGGANWLHQIAIGLTVLGVFIYFALALIFRYKKQIPTPPQGAILLPISGKVKSLKEGGGYYRLLLKKSLFDRVEVRCPVSGAYWENDELIVQNPKIRISFLGANLNKLSDAKFETGEVIAYIVGSAGCRLNIPANFPLLVQAGKSYEAGVSKLLLLDKVSSETVEKDEHSWANFEEEDEEQS